MSAGFCSVCGAVLRDGVCPHGHPQRASRLRRRPAPGRFRRTFGGLLLLLLLAGGAYAGLILYPQRAATDLMRPSSEEFAAAQATYRSTISLFPPGETDPQALVDQSNQVVAAVGDAREELGRATARLEEREPADWPVISGRPPLAQSRSTREDMLSFYTSALETLASLEGVAGYVTQVAAVIPRLDDLEQTLGTPEQAQVPAAVAAATPIADQVLADLQAITPPEEMGGTHASLLAIAQRFHDDLDEIARAGEQGSQPVINALVQDVGTELTSFRDAIGAVPRDARNASFGDRQAEVDRLAGRVVAGLEGLREEHGITGLTVPEPVPAPTTGV